MQFVILYNLQWFLIFKLEMSVTKMASVQYVEHTSSEDLLTCENKTFEQGRFILNLSDF